MYSEPMYTTAVGLIRYAHMQDDLILVHVQESSTVSANRSNHAPAPSKQETSRQNATRKKTGIIDKAKKVFDNFFE